MCWCVLILASGRVKRYSHMCSHQHSFIHSFCPCDGSLCCFPIHHWLDGSSCNLAASWSMALTAWLLLSITRVLFSSLQLSFLQYLLDTQLTTGQTGDRLAVPWASQWQGYRSHCPLSEKVTDSSHKIRMNGFYSSVQRILLDFLGIMF